MANELREETKRDQESEKQIWAGAEISELKKKFFESGAAVGS